ncbi:MAG: response regulator [Burkholderiaceae bacterium]|nr:MAG: response regulator [Burkholderiaceae bacterium]
MTDKQVLRVLIVDDYDMTRTLLRIILRGQNFEVVGDATDGAMAIEMCQRLKPDIMLLDVVMPRLNGLEVLAKLKASNALPLVLMVNRAEEEQVVAQAMQLGTSGYILKPFNTASVIETLNEARDRFIVRSAASVSRITPNNG